MKVLLILLLNDYHLKVVCADLPQPAKSFPNTSEVQARELDFIVKLIICWLDIIHTAISESDFKSLFDHIKRQVVIIVKHEMVKCRELESSPKEMRKFVSIIIFI